MEEMIPDLKKVSFANSEWEIHLRGPENPSAIAACQQSMLRTEPANPKEDPEKVAGERLYVMR